MNIKYLVLSLFAIMVYGCSSGGDDAQPSPAGPATEQSVFQASAKPSWNVDWTWNSPRPDWAEAGSHNYSCSMQMLVYLDYDLLPYASEDDLMAVFMNGTCRAISKPNIVDYGDKVVFLLNIQGDDEETRGEMTLQYYSAQQHHLFVIDAMPPFKPNNLWEDESSIVIWLGQGSTKFPYTTGVTVLLPDLPAFEKIEKDMAFVFVGDECRGVLVPSEQYPGFKGTAWSRQPGETAEIRYYSDSQQGYYTMKEKFVLNNIIQTIYFKY